MLEQDRKQALRCKHEKATQSTASPGKTNIGILQSCVSDGCIASRPLSQGAGANNDREKTSGWWRKHISGEEDLPCQTSNSTSSSVVEDSEVVRRRRTVESDQTAAYKIISVNNNHIKIDANRIREASNRRKCDGSANKKLMEAVEPEIEVKFG